MTLKRGADHKAKIIAKGKGAKLPMSPLGPAILPPVTVQLLNSRSECWEAVYPNPFTKNNGRILKDKLN